MLDADIPYGTDKESIRTCYQSPEAIEQSQIMPYFNNATFASSLIEQCNGKQECFPTFNLNDI